MFDVAASFEQYVLPTANAEPVVIDASTIVTEGSPPQIAEAMPIARRWWLSWVCAFAGWISGLS